MDKEIVFKDRKKKNDKKKITKQKNGPYSTKSARIKLNESSKQSKKNN